VVVVKPKAPKVKVSRGTKIKSALTSLLSIGVLVGLGAMIWGLFKMNPTNPAGVDPPKQPDSQIGLRFQEVELRGRKDGTPFFTIFADEVDVSRDSRYVNFTEGKKKPHGEFFNMKDWEVDIDPEAAKAAESLTEPRRRTITWEAKRAEYDTQKESLRMQEDVLIVTDTKDTIKTDEMIWDRGTQTLESNTRSHIRTHKGTRIDSNKLQAKTQDKELLLEGQVYIEMPLGKDQTLDVKED
jgi:lipopolysaccharide export system protein LptA